MECVGLDKGSFKNYVVLVGGEGDNSKDNLLHRPYLIKKTVRGEGGGGQKFPSLKRHSLWTTHNAEKKVQGSECFAEKLRTLAME